MGLDMYLYRQKFVSGEKAKQIRELVGEKEESNSVSVKTEVIYWRKANAIHKWFIDNTDGEDNQSDKYVDREKLEELLEVCKKVKASIELINSTELVDEWQDGKKVKVEIKVKKIKDTSVCEELLPTEDGFFFGSTSYDDYYLQDINYTIEQLEKVLEDKDECDYYYGCWW